MIRLVVLDTETGGLEPEDACIIELAAAEIEIYSPGVPNKLGTVVQRRFHSRVKSYKPVHPAAAKVNGYNEAEWDKESTFDVVGGDFLGWLDGIQGEGLVWCGSNVGFDLGFIASDLEHYGLPALPSKPKFSRRLLNTESLCFPLMMFGYVDSLGVNALGKWAGREGEQRHTASDDVDDCIAILREYLGRVSLKL